nr:orf1 [Paracoccus denitrificans PD1222]
MAHDLPQERILVVLISDFELSPDELAALLAALRPRPVLSVWLRDSGFDAPSPRLGLAELCDPETGRRRTVLTTPRWAARQAQLLRDRQAALRRILAEHGLSPIEITDSIDVAELAASLSEAPL